MTGNPYTGVGSNPYGIEGKNVITVYFAKAGDIFIDEDPTTPGSTETMVAKGMADWEKQAFWSALQCYENVADVVFVEVQDRAEADFKFITYIGTPGAGASLLGRMSPPDEPTMRAGPNSTPATSAGPQDGLQPGGFYFLTLIHEIGHGMGMAHPHDNGGHSSVMPGVDGGTGGIGGGLGDYRPQPGRLHGDVLQGRLADLALRPAGSGGPPTRRSTNWLGRVAEPLDIAVIQDKYGVNEDWATGNDTYDHQTSTGRHHLFLDLGRRRHRPDRLWRRGRRQHRPAPGDAAI